jgi:Formyl transferase
MVDGEPIRVVLLTALERGPMARIAHYLARVGPPEVLVVGAVIDVHAGPREGKRQLGRLSTWRRHGGIGYVIWRLALHSVARFRRPLKTTAYGRTLASLGEEFGFDVVEVATANSEECRRALADFGADIGLSVQNRMLQRTTFSVPPQGFINLHYGEIPAYRGQPPAFWELHDGASEMGVSVHRIDERLDHGDVLGRERVPVLADDDPARLFGRALGVDFKLVHDVLLAIRAGNETPLDVDWSRDRMRSIPTPRSLLRVRRRVGRRVHWDDYALAPLCEIEVAKLGDTVSPSRGLGRENLA